MPVIFLRLLASVGIPDRFQKAAAYAGLVILTIALVMGWMYFHDRKVIREHEAKVTAKIEKKDAAGDAAAAKAEKDARDDVEAGNARASEAANGSDDPLKAGLDALK